uniref:Uncharacterized protein n=1 Tax=Noctiluca scintillans TaxID=2966 RepID=A0A7S1FCV0_NOCSC
MTSMHSGTTFLCNLLLCAEGVYIVFPAFTGPLALPITERNTVPQIRPRSAGAFTGGALLCPTTCDHLPHVSNVTPRYHSHHPPAHIHPARSFQPMSMQSLVADQSLRTAVNWYSVTAPVFTEAPLDLLNSGHRVAQAGGRCRVAERDPCTPTGRFDARRT